MQYELSIVQFFNKFSFLCESIFNRRTKQKFGKKESTMKGKACNVLKNTKKSQGKNCMKKQKIEIQIHKNFISTMHDYN